MYDTNITIDIDATTASTYHGTVIIATQNVSETNIGSAHTINVYDDPTGAISDAIRIVWQSGSRNYNIYFVPELWSKNFIHIRAIGNYLDDTDESKICTQFIAGTAPSTTNGLTINNILKTTLNNYLPLSGGNLTGNLSGKYLTGTWLQTTATQDLGSAASKIAVINPAGLIYYRTAEEIKSDIGAVSKAGDTMAGNLTAPTFIGSLQGTATNATNIYSSASTSKAYLLGTTTASSGNHATTYNASVYTQGSVLYGAAWNDYAEYRQTDNFIEPGRVVCENGDDTLSLSVERLQPGAEIVSDTFGFAIGETEVCKTPIAATGRVLAYPYENLIDYKPGDAVCAGPNGTISKMTREEIINYPDRIIGTVSSIPNYETWGENNIKVNGRIWIRIR